MFDNAADFEALLWSMQQAAEPVQFASASLARKVEQFRSRGRLVMFDDEIITESEWIAALIGLGHVPERVTPLAIPAPLDAVERNYERLRRAISQAAGSLPRQQVYLDHLMALEGAGPDAV